MRISTNDGAFGFVIWKAPLAFDSRFFGFQLVIAGQIIGDEYPSIIGSAMQSLANLAEVDDPRFARPGEDPGGTMAIAIADDVLHDLVVFNHAESLDGWSIVAYRQQGSVTWLARPSGVPLTSTTFATVSVVEYDEIQDQVVTYWTRRST